VANPRARGRSPRGGLANATRGASGATRRLDDPRAGPATPRGPGAPRDRARSGGHRPRSGPRPPRVIQWGQSPGHGAAPRRPPLAGRETRDSPHRIPVRFSGDGRELRSRLGVEGLDRGMRPPLNPSGADPTAVPPTAMRSRYTGAPISVALLRNACCAGRQRDRAVSWSLPVASTISMSLRNEMDGGGPRDTVWRKGSGGPGLWLDGRSRTLATTRHRADSGQAVRTWSAGNRARPHLGDGIAAGYGQG
jgi:hypothetical protein